MNYTDTALFGTAGNALRFYDEGHTKSEEAPAWLAAQGLDAYEYSAGHGVTLREKTAREIGEAARAANVRVSLHAPYYINCASTDQDKREKSIGYLLAAARACADMGGGRVVFHVGAPQGEARDGANLRARETVLEALRRMDGAGLSGVSLCPETMGRPSQLGTLEETLSLCEADARLIPALDFGHLHAAGQGCLRDEEAFDRVLARLIERLGIGRARAFHAHFSKLLFTDKGEKRHVTFADADCGPDFAHLAPPLIARGLTPVIICESKGTQADDAAAMKDIYLRALAQGTCNTEQNSV